MRALIGLLCLTALSCRPATGPPPLQARWEHSAEVLGSIHELHERALRKRSPNCGFPLRIESVLPDPTTLPDRVGEWVELRHLEVERLDLSGWRLESSGRTRHLEPQVLLPGQRVRVGGPLGPLRPVQLRNSGGFVVLRDPCGLEISRLQWGSAHGVRLAPGERLSRERPWVQNARTPPEGSQAGPRMVAADGFEPST